MTLPLRTSSRERSHNDELRSREDAIDDSIDVPAAVVCAFCGDAECAGCDHERSRSGIVALVAWERSDQPLLTRFWATARATSFSGEAFFELLPDGAIAPALRFALLAELIASIGFVVSSIPFVAAIAPGWIRHVVVDASARDLALRVLLLGIPGLALLLVCAHVAHGLALDRGARKNGGRPARNRALRFGLYATGWDIVLGPIGVCVLLAKGGIAGVTSIATVGIGLPLRCARAFLRGSYRLEGRPAIKANQTATAAAIAATLVGALAVLAVAVVLAFA